MPQDGKLDEASERWVKVARELGFSDFLTAADGFRRCDGNRTWTNANQPGIYFWLAADGQAYVGQSVRPRARLHQHMKVHGDILRAAFQACGPNDLDNLEARLVDLAGEHFPLRNIKLAVSTVSDVLFDRIVTAAEQPVFLAGGELPTPNWRNLEQLERLQHRKFERLLEHALGRAAIAAARLFVSRTIPKPHATEVGFWSATIRPCGRLVRINVGQQEVFTFEDNSRRGSIRVFTADRVNWLRSWQSPYQTRSYETVIRPDKLATWLTGSRLLSCRKLIVQLMRHTQALNSGSHCPQLMRDASVAPRAASVSAHWS